MSDVNKFVRKISSCNPIPATKMKHSIGNVNQTSNNPLSVLYEAKEKRHLRKKEREKVSVKEPIPGMCTEKEQHMLKTK